MKGYFALTSRGFKGGMELLTLNLLYSCCAAAKMLSAYARVFQRRSAGY